MSVVGSYTPVSNWNIETVFTPDADMDNNSRRGATIWEFSNANYFISIIFEAFRWTWHEERFNGTSWINHSWSIDLDGVADTPFGYSFYKENLVPITILCIYDYSAQRRKIFVNGYLLGIDYAYIPAINQSMTLFINNGPVYDRFDGTIDSIVYDPTAPSPAPLPNPTPVEKITHYNKNYVPYTQNWFPVDDNLVQYQKWPDPQFDLSTNPWVECAYDLEYFAGSQGQNPPVAGVVTKAVLLQQMLSSNKWRHSIRVAVLQPLWADKAQPVNVAKALIAYANANPLIRAIFGAAMAQVQAIPPNTIPNLQTLPLGTPVSALDGLRNTFFQQTQYLLSLLTRAINGFYLDDEQLKHWLTYPSLAGVNAYVSWINHALGELPVALPPPSLRGSIPAQAESVVYDVYNLTDINYPDFPVGPMLKINSTGNGTISQYTDKQKYWLQGQGPIRGLINYLKSKYAEIQAGRQLNQPFIQGGRKFEEAGPRPGMLLGLWKCYKVAGAERLYSAYFTPDISVGIQQPKGYAWQAAAASYVEAVFSKPKLRNILLYGVLLDGDVKQFPSNPSSAPMYLHDCGNKLCAVLARKYNGEYLIEATYQPLNNYEGQPETKTINVTIDGINLTLEARIQGSTYYRDINGVLTMEDEWHESTHFDWWGDVIINPNLNTDMAGINDIGKGYGLIYKVDLSNPSPSIVSIQKNDVEGEREMRRQGVVDAPIGANSSATGLIQILGVASTGTIGPITIDGNDILDGNVLTVGSAVPATEATALAVLINSITPSAGLVYKAYSIDDIVYLQSPIDQGTAVNDLTIAVTASDVSIVTQTTPFYDGTNATEVYDTLSGYRYFLNADYDANGTPNTLTAPDDSLLYAIEITKWMITRGNNTGMMQKSITLQTDSILSADRGSQNMELDITPETGTSDVLVFIATKGFVEGDILFLKSAVAGSTIQVESAPVTTSPNPYKNIYLANDFAAALTDKKSILMLQYTYDDQLGGIFVEITRAFSSTGDCIFWEGNYSDASNLLTNSKLVACNVYKINDRSVVLRAKSVNEFELQGTYIADYTGSGKVGGFANEACEYNFALDIITQRTDARGNYVRNSGDVSGLIPWGYPNVTDNIHVDSQALTMEDDSTSIKRCVFQNAEQVLAKSGTSLYGCDFIKTRGNITINGFAFTNRSYNGATRKSTFEVTRSPDGNGNIEMGDEWYCGVILCSGALVVLEQICRTDGVYSLMWTDVEVGQTDGNSLTIVNKFQASLSANPNLIFSQTNPRLLIPGAQSQRAIFRFQNNPSATNQNCFVYTFEDPAFVETVTGDTTAASQSTLLCDATGGAIVVTLPLASGVSGKILTVKKIDASGNTVTLTPGGGELIDGAATKVISTQYDFYQIQTDGNNWYII